MGATAKGYPYPDPTDPVANTDLAIKALATFLETNGFKAIHAGNQLVNLAASAQGASGSIVFPVGKFSAAPIVVCSCGSGTAQYFGVVSSLTAAAMAINVRRADGAAVTASVQLYWIALQLA